MANPLLLHENLLADSTGTLTASSSASGFPVTNINDWRPGVSYRWKATATTDQTIDMDAGAGNTLAADTFCMAGHNFGTVAARISIIADTFTPPTTIRKVGFTPTDDLPLLVTFTEQNLRYWRIFIDNTPSAVVQAGVMALGRRIDYDAGALMDLDPYNRSSKVEPFINNNGSPIGVNVREQTKMFQMSYGEANGGMRTSSFYDTITPDIKTGWLPHAVDNAKPFFFAWNIDVDSDEIYLCRVQGPTVSLPFVGSTTRIGFRTTFIAHRETS